MCRRKKELEDNVRYLGTRLDVANIKMGTLRVKLDAVSAKTHATDTNLTNLQRFMTNAFRSMDIKMDTLRQVVDTSEHAVKQAIKVHESFNTLASNRSNTAILRNFAESNRKLREHTSREAHVVQANAEKHAAKLAASIDKIGIDSIKEPSILAEISQLGNQIGEQIKQQTADAKAHAEAAAVTQEEISERIRSFQSTVVWFQSDVSGHGRHLHE